MFFCVFSLHVPRLSVYLDKWFPPVDVWPGCEASWNGGQHLWSTHRPLVLPMLDPCWLSNNFHKRHFSIGNIWNNCSIYDNVINVWVVSVCCPLSFSSSCCHFVCTVIYTIQWLTCIDYYWLNSMGYQITILMGFQYSLFPSPLKKEVCSFSWDLFWGDTE